MLKAMLCNSKEVEMRYLSRIIGLLLVVCLIGGCGKGQSAAPAGEAHDHEEHSHADEGPHGGHIIELGTEQYHAELIHEAETNRVGVYLLGSDAKTPAPIDAASVTINVRVEGNPEQYILPAVPQPGEPAGKSSYFELVSEPLHKVVAGQSESKAMARLSINIEGKPYSGLIETDAHDHDHGHDHAH
jgi:hypothetical protein